MSSDHSSQSSDRSSQSPQASSSSSSSSLQIQAGRASVSARQPLSRRGHFKSRMGCFNCKRRRVKCNELRPQCSPCRRLALDCAYPPTPAPASLVRPNPSMLALEDLRFYHQFIATALPPLPVKAHPTWMHCAAMSHEYEFLAHAILGLGASHLTRHSTADYTSQALHHRLVAIKQVNEQLSNPPTCQKTLDALLAALFCLITQSSLIDDGLADYMTITRGGHLIVIIIVGDMSKSIFSRFSIEGHDADTAALVCEDQREDLTEMQDFTASVVALEPFIHAPYERAYHALLLNVASEFVQSSHRGWVAYSAIYRMPAGMNSADFIELINPENHVCRLMLIHMFLVDYVLAKACLPPDIKSRAPARKNVIVKWARNAVASVPARQKHLTTWIQSYCDKLERTADCRHLFTP